MASTACSGPDAASLAEFNESAPVSFAESQGLDPLGPATGAEPHPGAPLTLSETSYDAESPGDLGIVPSGGDDRLVAAGEPGELAPESLTGIYRLAPSATASSGGDWARQRTGQGETLALGYHPTGPLVTLAVNDPSADPDPDRAAGLAQVDADLVLGLSADAGESWEWYPVPVDQIERAKDPTTQRFDLASDGTHLYLIERLEPKPTASTLEDMARSAGVSIDRRGRDGSALIATPAGVDEHQLNQAVLEGSRSEETGNCADDLFDALLESSSAVADHQDPAAAANPDLSRALASRECEAQITCEYTRWAARFDPGRLVPGLPQPLVQHPGMIEAIGSYYHTQAETCAAARSEPALVTSTSASWADYGVAPPPSMQPRTSTFEVLLPSASGASRLRLERRPVDPDLFDALIASAGRPGHPAIARFGDRSFELAWDFDAALPGSGGVSSTLSIAPVDGSSDPVKVSLAQLDQNLPATDVASYVFDQVVAGPYGVVVVAYRVEGTAERAELVATSLYFSADGSAWAATELFGMYVDVISVGRQSVLIATQPADTFDGEPVVTAPRLWSATQPAS